MSRALSPFEDKLACWKLTVERGYKCKMIRLFSFVTLFVLATNADVLVQAPNRGATLKPISACCDIPEIGDPKHLAECSNPRPVGPCKDVECVFEKSGFLTDKNILNKEAYKKHLLKWLEDNKGWTVAIEKVINDCVEKDLRQYLDYPCKAYDVFACTGIAMLKKCPNEFWKC